jgi:hypothetical protein
VNVSPRGFIQTGTTGWAGVQTTLTRDVLEQITETGAHAKFLGTALPSPWTATTSNGEIGNTSGGGYHSTVVLDRFGLSQLTQSQCRRYMSDALVRFPSQFGRVYSVRKRKGRSSTIADAYLNNLHISYRRTLTALLGSAAYSKYKRRFQQDIVPLLDCPLRLTQLQLPRRAWEYGKAFPYSQVRRMFRYQSH